MTASIHQPLTHSDPVSDGFNSDEELILDWEDELDSLGPYADLALLEDLLSRAPEKAPSLTILRDMIFIRNRMVNGKK